MVTFITKLIQFRNKILDYIKKVPKEIVETVKQDVDIRDNKLNVKIFGTNIQKEFKLDLPQQGGNPNMSLWKLLDKAKFPPNAKTLQPEYLRKLKVRKIKEPLSLSKLRNLIKAYQEAHPNFPGRISQEALKVIHFSIL